MTRVSHPLAGQTVKLDLTIDMPDFESGMDYTIEDWFDNVTGSSWMDADGNIAAMMYALRAGFGGIPLDDDVLYGKTAGFGYLVHGNEIVYPEEAA